jgi:hypothetical protein
MRIVHGKRDGSCYTGFLQAGSTGANQEVLCQKTLDLGRNDKIILLVAFSPGKMLLFQLVGRSWRSGRARFYSGSDFKLHNFPNGIPF